MGYLRLLYVYSFGCGFSSSFRRGTAVGSASAVAHTPHCCAATPFVTPSESTAACESPPAAPSRSVSSHGLRVSAAVSAAVSGGVSAGVSTAISAGVSAGVSAAVSADISAAISAGVSAGVSSSSFFFFISASSIPHV